ncbi:hypothetical protein HB777_33640 [Mesorhizobium loti]|nr:hypothetical protein HB777_33640 [Mesorhizobium loti]
MTAMTSLQLRSFSMASTTTPKPLSDIKSLTVLGVISDAGIQTRRLALRALNNEAHFHRDPAHAGIWKILLSFQEVGPFVEAGFVRSRTLIGAAGGDWFQLRSTGEQRDVNTVGDLAENSYRGSRRDRDKILVKSQLAWSGAPKHLAKMYGGDGVRRRT